MSKIFLINHKYKGSLFMFFEDEQEAEEFCKLANYLYVEECDSLHNNTFVVKEVNVFKNFEDYANKNKSSYEKILKQSIKNLNNHINELENGKKIAVKLDNDYLVRLSLKEIKEIALFGKLPENIMATTENSNLTKCRKIKKTDILEIVKEYEFSRKRLENMKKDFAKYKKEYLKVTTSKTEEDFNLFKLM